MQRNSKHILYLITIFSKILHLRDHVTHTEEPNRQCWQ